MSSTSRGVIEGEWGPAPEAQRTKARGEPREAPAESVALTGPYACRHCSPPVGFPSEGELADHWIEAHRPFYPFMVTAFPRNVSPGGVA